MLRSDATRLVPFLADLVSMADPTSRWSFLNHLKQTGRLYPFYIRESFYPLRKEYSDYCRWVAEQLDSVHFDSPVARIAHNSTSYVVTPCSGRLPPRRRLVLGPGTHPGGPKGARG